jgi:hypothetical protein
MALTFFKTPKNKSFNYKPVFYDKKKEEQKKRLQSAIEEGGDDYAGALRERMQMRWRRNSGAKDQRASRQRLIIILSIIGLLFYLIFFI